jgi:hypothetical protein
MNISECDDEAEKAGTGDPTPSYTDPRGGAQGNLAAGDPGPEERHQVRQVVAGRHDVFRPHPGMEIVAAVPERAAPTSKPYC